MRRNVSRIDVNIRRIAAFLLAGMGAFMLAVGSYIGAGATFALAVYLLVTGTVRFAPEYVPFGYHSKRHPERGPLRK